MSGRRNKWGHRLDQVDVACAECGTKADPVGGEEVYPHRPDLAHKRFYKCPSCPASYVGCHPNTWEPLGRPAGADTRAARSDAHAHFDPIWKEAARRDGDAEGKQDNARKRGYRWLAGQLGIAAEECHIGMMDRATAQRVRQICEPHLRRLGLQPERRGR